MSRGEFQLRMGLTRHIRSHPPIRIADVGHSSNYVNVADAGTDADSSVPPGSGHLSHPRPPRPRLPKLARPLPNSKGRPIPTQGIPHNGVQPLRHLSCLLRHRLDLLTRIVTGPLSGRVFLARLLEVVDRGFKISQEVLRYRVCNERLGQCCRVLSRRPRCGQQRLIGTLVPELPSVERRRVYGDRPRRPLSADRIRKHLLQTSGWTRTDWPFRLTCNADKPTANSQLPTSSRILTTSPFPPTIGAPMTPDELDRTIDFILKNQADSVLRMDKLAKSQDRVDAQIDGLTERLNNLASISDNLISITDTLASTTGDLVSTTSDLVSTTGDLVSTTGDLVGVSGHLLTTQDELVESNRLLTQLVTHQAQRLDRLEDQPG